MLRLKLMCGLLVGVLVVGASGFEGYAVVQRGRRAQGAAKVCANPNLLCKTSATFEPHDLPFRVPANAVIWETEQFYAVILKSIRVPEGDCEQFVTEAERLAAQALFPTSKVFSSRCADPGSLYYTNVAPNQQFMAVYAGLTQAEAARMLANVKATGKFPGANLRRMRAGFNGT